jgi:hypothetical protein
MKILIYLSLFIFSTTLFASFASNESCTSCHPLIAKEYQKAMHSKATIFKDPIHKAAWEKSPAFQKDFYNCGRCHTPADTNMMYFLDNNTSIMPDIHNKAQNDAVACAYCHRIKSIKKAERQNYNITNKKEHLYYGNLKNPKENLFHKSAKNKGFENGNMCIGCHSHFKNNQGINVCSTNQKNELDSANCVSCHMPKVDGPPSTAMSRAKHAFHGFAGIHNNMLMMNKHIGIEILKSIDRFFISINSRTPHALTLHPMRDMRLKVSVIRDGNKTDCKIKDFIRSIGNDENATLPWEATKIIQNTSIKANEKRVSTYMYTLEKGDIVDVQVGYYLMNEKTTKMLGLKENKKLQEFRLLKHKVFTID